MHRIAFVAGLLIAVPVSSHAAETADAIYHGGPIVTIDAKKPSAEALAVKDGEIVAVGSKTDVLKLQGDATKVIDLQGHTLLPGFVDGHSHFINSLLVARQANCLSPPAGPVRSIADIVAALKALQERLAIPAGEFIAGYGYDPDMLSDARPMTAADLDAAFPDNPVFVQHVSMHGAVCNSAALAKFNITKDTPTPPGGVIVRKPGSTEPEGLIMESAWLPVMDKLPRPSEGEQLKQLVAAQQIYTAAGLTTAQEGATKSADVELLFKAADQGLLVLDVVSYPFITEIPAVLKKHPPETFGKYHNRLKLGGAKITADGSPQGKTAWFTTPYLTGGPGGEKNWTGEPTFTKTQTMDMVKQVYDHKLQLLVHCNGDAAIDLLLAAHEYAAGDGRFTDRRTVCVHSQFVRPDQLQKYVAYKILPSFYTEHCFYFGQAHLKNRGRDQTYFISPMKTALSMGIRCANHTDFNVAPIDQLFVIWSAVNRVSRSGGIIGPNERITPLQALTAITLDGAYMYGEEASKGSLEVGKLADLVILDGNPLTVEPMTIKDLKVLETIKEGETIYRAGN